MKTVTHERGSSLDIAVLLDDHIDRMQCVRSVVWAMSELLRQAASCRRTSASLMVELKLLGESSVRMADQFLDDMVEEKQRFASH